MSDYESKIRDYYSLRPTQYSTLQSLTLSQGTGPSGVCEQSVSLVLSKGGNDEDECLHIDFFGVRHLIIQQPDWSLITIGHVEVLAGSKVPKVTGNYLVRDPEQERILWFECMDFNAVIG